MEIQSEPVGNLGAKSRSRLAFPPTRYRGHSSHLAGPFLSTVAWAQSPKTCAHSILHRGHSTLHGPVHTLPSPVATVARPPVSSDRPQHHIAPL